MTTIELTDQDAQLFLEFQKFYTLFGLLKSVNVFAIRNGSVTINFNHLGQIKGVNKLEHFNNDN